MLQSFKKFGIKPEIDKFSDKNSPMLDDLNTPSTISFLSNFEDLKSKMILGPYNEENLKNPFMSWFIYSNLLGLLQKDPEDWFKGGVDTAKFDALVKEYDAVRAQALAAKEAGDKAAMGAAFKRSDEIRDELKAQGIVIETGASGSSWRKA